METMQNVALATAAAEDMKAKLSFVAKQVQLCVNALQHDTTGNKCRKGCKSQGCVQGQGSPVRRRDSPAACF